MTLEDFFTLTEMKDGLTTPARVEELVSVLKKEKDSLMKNIGDATRQRASVASTVVATENKECLDLFVQLDGLCFLDGWLKDAQIFAKDGGDTFVEEAISLLLQAVEKLQIDNERLISSGICITVENLLSYSSNRVQDQARTLFDSWKAKNVDLISMDVEKSASGGNPTPNNEHSDTRVAAKNVSSFQSIDDNHQCNSQKPLDYTASEGGCHDTVASPVVESDISVGEVSPSDGKADQPRSSDPKQSNNEASSEVSKSERVLGNAGRCDKTESVCDRLGKVEVSSASDSVDVPSNNGATVVKEANIKSAHEKNDANNDLAVKRISSDDANLLIGESRNEIDVTRSPEHKDLDRGGGCSMLEKSRDQQTSPSRVKDAGSHSEAKKCQRSNRKYFGNSCGFARLTKSSKNNVLNHTNMDLEDGTVDALEVACLLAKEVEREVMGYDEQSGSASSDEMMSRSSHGQPESPESINGEDPEINAPSNDLPTTNSVSREPSKIQHMIDPTNRDANLENQAQDMESSSQVTDSLREPEVNTDRSVCEFDLNQEFSSVDPDDQIDDISNLVVPGGLADLTQFGGSLDRVSDGEKAHSDGGTSSNSQQRRGFLDIDLNVAEAGESSVESSPRRSDKMKIDLNLIQTGEDGDDMPCVLKMNEEILELRNTQRSPSPASSSTCLQPSMRNFDLNDNPSHSSNLSNQHPFMSESSSNKTSSYVGPSDDSGFSILGVKVKRNAVVPQTSPFLNKRVPEPLMDNTHLLRGGTFVGLGHAVPYGQSVYGYNGLAMGPLVSFPPGLTYGPGGPVPYMFDSRGAPVIMPQILGSAPTIPPSYGQPSFAMNMMGSSPPVSNVPGSLGPNLDLNSEFTAEGGNRDPGFFKQFLGPGHGRPLQEQLRDNFGPFSSGSSSGKRKEPDTCWDLYTANYKHHQPPHL